MKLFGDNRVRSAVLFVSAALLVAACASVATQMSGADDDASAQSGDLPASAVAEAKPKPPPFVAPPAPSTEQWTIPDVQQHHPTFPYLPGEAHDVSRSVGDVTHGWLVDARRIPTPSRYIEILPAQYGRALNYTSEQMLALVKSAAAHVAKKYPGSVLHIGDFSAQGGGDIPYSVSHNSGRDADLGFFVLGPDGKPTTEPDLLPMDEHGRYEGDQGTFVFDVARNWALIEGLIAADAATLQYIFVSKPLKRMLLKEARRQKASRRIIAKAQVLLHQPGGALPHNDHFHLRVYCSKTDVRSGCKDYGRRVAGYHAYGRARRRTIARAATFLKDTSADVRLAAVRRLALLDADGRADDLATMLDDADPRVRAASARALGQLGRGGHALATRLPREDNPQVLVEIIASLGDLGDKVALQALEAELDKPHPVSLPGEFHTDARAFVAEALIKTESAAPVPKLIGLLDSPDANVRMSAARALRILTNHRLATWKEIAAKADIAAVTKRWHDWYAQHRHEDRDQWLACGFEDAGYEVAKLDVKNVWDLCRAVAGADYLSYNAQRVLMRLSGRHPASLSWPKDDANFYWRRWFERRWRRFGAPPIPKALSTLQ